MARGDDDRRDSKALHDEVVDGEGRGRRDKEEVEGGGEGRAQHGNGEGVEEVEEVEDGDGRDPYDEKEGDEVLLADELHLVSVRGNLDHELPQKILGRLL